MRIHRYEWFWTAVGPEPERERDRLLGLLLRFLINAAALLAASALVRGVTIHGWGAYLFGAAIFGLVNAFIRPLFFLLTLPFTCLTLGLFILVVNAAMLGLTAWIAGQLGLDFQVDGFIAAVLGALVVSVVSFLLTRFLRVRVAAQVWRV